MKYDKHIFICINQREGKESCGDATGMKLVELFKKAIASRKLNISIRAQRAGCLDVCSFGPALVVYPEGVFYGKVEETDVEEIVQSHIVNNVPVERLKLKF
jgi:(2Fe-2S) ferredoxin